ncbi:MAG: NAD(P)-dependent oxidoreductase, partial [Parolsenella sp.]|uniref:NAD(P)-dependent oxidoreductase n=1 Tax=Parolsenella sp. TaxID=2083006 RepID=UPI002E75C8D8
TDASELARRSAGVDVVMIANNPYPAEVVRGADALKMIAVAFTGVDHVGLDAARERGITVCNCAGYSDVSVAELAVGLAIDVLRHVVPADAATRAGGTSAGLMGREISGKTVGIVGTGHIGCVAARLFGAFGARVLGFARHESEAARAAGIEFVGLDELLAESDIVSLHLPLTPETRGFFDAEKIARMKDGAVLVNCARGPIVDNDALAAALNSGKLAGAGIDVFDMEPPLPEGFALASAKNCVLTPHVAYLTEEAMERRAVIEFGNVLAWLGGAPKNVCAL